VCSFVNFSFLRARWKILAAFNAMFFGGIFITLVLSGAFLHPPVYTGWHPNVPELFVGDGWLLLILGTFIFNLAWNSFVCVAMPGVVFFPLSAGFLLYRAFLWGLYLYAQPTWLFIVLLPVTLLECEAYVLAAVAGTVLGASWVLPNQIYSGHKQTRVQVLKKAARELSETYILISVFLLVAAIIETIITWAIV